MHIGLYSAAARSDIRAARALIIDRGYQETAADISDTTRDFGWTPKVPVEEGIPAFVEWFKTYNRL